jgi:hypothetical protein
LRNVIEKVIQLNIDLHNIVQTSQTRKGPYDNTECTYVNLGIVKILHCIRSDMYTAKIHRNFFFGRKMGPLTNGALCLSTPKHNGKSGPDPTGV